MSGVPEVFEPSPAYFSALAIIVLYKMKYECSPAYRSLLEARQKLSPKTGTVEIVLWDNSPFPQQVDHLPEGVSYFSDPRNTGLATAYNHALDVAAEKRVEWLITLDQDTALPPDYLSEMAAAAQKSSCYAGVGAVVPQIEGDGRRLSPNCFVLGAIPSWYRHGYCGVPGEAVFAFNSGAMFRVAALRQVGGYTPWFWLDHCDAYIFVQLHRHGKRVYVAGNVQVQHEFSMKKLEERMTTERYRNALLAESAFWDLYMNRLAGCERTLRLAVRWVRQWIRGDSAEMRRLTGEALRNRVFSTSEKRLETWRRKTREHLGDVLRNSHARDRRLKVSACMAAYNGGQYIDLQLRSILSQLHEEDEVVIVDDCSSDDTVGRIAAMRDPRIRLLKHTRNGGVVATFEDVLRSAAGDILFLSDDDDIWAPHKVQRFLHEFEMQPNAGIVTSKASLIDESGYPLPDSRLNRRGRFQPGFWRNLLMNHYQGSAMALRASLLGRVLPFPRRMSFLHDAWIGTRNDALGGKIAFVNDNLLFYRRHAQNASRTEPLWRQIKKRAELLLAHAMHVLRIQAP